MPAVSTWHILELRRGLVVLASTKPFYLPLNEGPEQRKTLLNLKINKMKSDQPSSVGEDSTAKRKRGDEESEVDDSGGTAQEDEKPKKREKRRYHYRNKKPSGMPKRPLSAYNYFFREQRPIILAKIESDRANETASAAEDGNSEEGKSPSLFSTMGKSIAEAWKNITPEDKEKYKAMAAEDMKRYREEMDKYHKAVAEASRKRPSSEPPEADQKVAALASTAGIGAMPISVQGVPESSNALGQNVMRLQQHLLQSRGMGNLAGSTGMAGVGLLGNPSLNVQNNPAAMDSSLLHRQMLNSQLQPSLLQLAPGMDPSQMAYPGGIPAGVPGPSRLEQLLMLQQHQQQQQQQQSSQASTGAGDQMANSGMGSAALQGGMPANLMELMPQQQNLGFPSAGASNIPDNHLRLLLLQQRRQEEQLLLSQQMQMLSQQQNASNAGTATAQPPAGMTDQLRMQLLAQQQAVGAAGGNNPGGQEVTAQPQQNMGGSWPPQPAPDGGDDDSSQDEQG